MVKKFIIGTLMLLSSLTIYAQSPMLPSMSIPSLGGGTNAHAGTYTGDGVFVGVATLHSQYLNFASASVLWNTGWDVLGAKYSMMIAQPMLMDGSYKNHFFPVVYITPLQLSWDLGNTKLQGSYSALIGRELPVDAHLISVKATQYILDGKYSLNGGVTYEHRVARPELGRTLGSAMVFEANISRHFTNGSTVGVFGYYNTNTSQEIVEGRSLFNDISGTRGIGVDTSHPLGKHLFLNGKFIYDMQPNKVTRCNKVVLSLAYKF
ncbi:transporter family protein [Flammeovirga aprica]|uniref:Transporter n=1 Tax=Flammeovirga aprica JL-4 TaxID=694437 RepID=A0A7X9RSN1_9BACT|nr:hypothetical protein [Flammeovirga aprica]NME67291.1 transporter [Flammeovirga aprica JL-4]